jgi:serine/threonine-protein kinase
MAEQHRNLDALVESVADGESIDWGALERVPLDEESRESLRCLRIVAEVAEVHRSRLDEAAFAEDDIRTAPLGELAEGRLPPRADRGPGKEDEGPVAARPDQRVWGHLVLVRRIGEGAFGEVYLAHDTWLDHPVALKLLKPEAESRVSPSQILHEARKLARVRHPNVVTVHGADRHDGRVGFWMDFVDGETLASRVVHGRLSAGEAVHVGQEVCRALAAVHRANLIHRDVKAQNVMRASDGGRIILMDFGAGEFQNRPSPSRAQGTPLYLAPELLHGGKASVRTDIYAVGILLYHLVTGRFPVDAASKAGLVEAHARGGRKRLRDERPDLSDSFVSIVERAIDPDPARRFASAGEMEAALAGETAAALAPLSRERASSAADLLRRAAAALAGLVALAGIMGFIATRVFEVVLRVDTDFSAGVGDTFAVGASALFPFVVFWLLGAAALGALAVVRTMLRGVIGDPWSRLTARAGTVDPFQAAAAIFLVGALSWIALWVTYGELRVALDALRAGTASVADLAILGPERRGLHRIHGIVSAYVSMALGLAVWRYFPGLEARAREIAGVRLLKWGTAALALIVVATEALPRRFVWESFPVAVYEDRPAFVIGSTTDELLLYRPEDRERPRVRARRGVTQPGELRALFAQEPSTGP